MFSATILAMAGGVDPHQLAHDVEATPQSVQTLLRSYDDILKSYYKDSEVLSEVCSAIVTGVEALVAGEKGAAEYCIEAIAVIREHLGPSVETAASPTSDKSNRKGKGKASDAAKTTDAMDVDPVEGASVQAAHIKPTGVVENRENESPMIVDRPISNASSDVGPRSTTPTPSSAPLPPLSPTSRAAGPSTSRSVANGISGPSASKQKKPAAKKTSDGSDKNPTSKPATASKAPKSSASTSTKNKAPPSSSSVPQAKRVFTAGKTGQLSLATFYGGEPPQAPEPAPKKIQKKRQVVEVESDDDEILVVSKKLKKVK